MRKGKPMSEEELKPCPFCGGKAIIMQHWKDFKTNKYIVKCIKCGAQTDAAVKEHISILWNTRKPMLDIEDKINDEMALEWDNEESMYNLGLKKALEIVQKGGAE